MTVNTSKNLLATAWMRLTDGLHENLTAPDHDYSEVYAQVLKLPLKYRTVIHLHYFEGYSCEEISKLTSTKEATVKTQLSRGRKMLEEALKGEF